jgi:hypothetical protein
MSRIRTAASTLALVGSVATAAPLFADVKTEDKTLVKFEGALGRVVNFFGGKAAKEGVKTTVALQGDRKAVFTDADGTIVDLGEEKIYSVDLKKKSYSVMTFAEMRRRMEEARKRAEEEARKAEGREEKPAEKGREVEVDFTVRETGERRAINGFDTKQAIMTITVREKGKTLEEAGGLVMTSDVWLTPAIPAMKELLDFELRYAQAIGLTETLGASAEQMQAALAAHPQLKEAIGRMAEEGRKLQGTPILSTTTVDAVKSAEQMAAAQQQKQEASEPEVSGGVGGLLGGFGKRMAKKKAGGDEPPKARATVMTTTSEKLSVSTAVAAGDVAIPAGFKENK